MIIVIPGAYNAQTGVVGGNIQGQTVTVGAILKVTERDRRPYPSDSGSPSEIWIDNTAAIGYICKENGPTGTVWDRLDLLGDYIAFGDGNPGPNADILWGYRPGSLRYARNSQTLWICDDNTQGAAIWSVLAGGGSGGTYTVNNGLTPDPLNPNNFQLGGATLGTGNLVRDTYITNDGYLLRIDQTNASTYALDLRHSGTGLNTGAGLRSQAGGIAVRASSSENWAFEGVSTLDYTAALLRSTSSTNNAVGLLKLVRNTSGIPSGDIGGSIDFWIEARLTGIPAPGSPIDPTVRLAGIWEVPGPAVLSRLSRFDMYGYSNGGTLLNASVRGDGKFVLHQYGVNTFAGTPAYALGVDASGNVVEFTGGGPPTTGDSVSPFLLMGG